MSPSEDALRVLPSGHEDHDAGAQRLFLFPSSRATPAAILGRPLTTRILWTPDSSWSASQRRRCGDCQFNAHHVPSTGVRRLLPARVSGPLRLAQSRTRSSTPTSPVPPPSPSRHPSPSHLAPAVSAGALDIAAIVWGLGLRQQRLCYSSSPTAGGIPNRSLSQLAHFTAAAGSWNLFTLEIEGPHELVLGQSVGNTHFPSPSVSPKSGMDFTAQCVRGMLRFSL
ncbi:hypothetical protein AURDEDRAFT_177282 [Auricularia subglabra TFB-10046 SS5]|uniref:Uncharacterized protein n=1 Tax=Auricularia subglabra (strain TFB-10046 / SS5) TaxID=717982 RepID=J0LB26_AURST|nr:hypothetical protein AURDEDRAFT_177282 [Auricularia subglabra TFB-10046 SS5]